MAIVNCLQEFIRLKILRIGTRTESAPAGIDRVRAGIDGSADPFHAAPGSKNLHSILLPFPGTVHICISVCNSCCYSIRALPRTD